MSKKMSEKKSVRGRQIDMLQGSLMDKLLLFALPLAASNILQQLFNSADAAVVGRFAGSQALAAVGGNTSVINLLLNLFVGISVGANVVIARYIGQNKIEKVQEAVHTVIAVALISGFFLIGIGMALAKPILLLMSTPKDVINLAVLYLRIYFAGMPFLMVYNFGAAILRSVGDTRRPLYCLLFTGVINVGLNLLFVVGLEMSVAGVALATMIANAISAGLVVYFLINEEGVIRLNIRRLTMKKEHLLEILRVGVPAGIQGMVFSLSNICIQTGINSFGSAAVAGSASAVNFEFFTYFVTNSFVQATVTFTSQNFGAKQFDRCKKIFRYCLMSAMVGTGLMALVFLAGKNVFIKIYTVEPEVIKFALIRMTYVLTMIFLPPTYEIAGAALRGIGYSMLPAAITIVGCCGFRVVWIYTVFRIFGTFESLMAVYPATWVLTGTMMQMSYYVIRKKVFASKTAER